MSAESLPGCRVGLHREEAIAVVLLDTSRQHSPIAEWMQQGCSLYSLQYEDTETMAMLPRPPPHWLYQWFVQIEKRVIVCRWHTVESIARVFF